MKLPFKQATRPIELRIDRNYLLDYLHRLVRKLGSHRFEQKQGIFETLEMPTDLKNYLGKPLEKVILLAELEEPENMFGGPGLDIEGYCNREAKTITFRFSLVVPWIMNLVSPDEIEDSLLPTLIHELTHLVDNRSNRDMRRQEKANNLANTNRMRHYFNKDNEIRAHLKQICYWEVDPLFRAKNKLEEIKIPDKSLQEVIKEILANPTYQKLFNYITKQNKNKILKGIATRYEDLVNNPSLRANVANLHNGLRIAAACMPRYAFPEVKGYDPRIGYWGVLGD